MRMIVPVILIAASLVTGSAHAQPARTTATGGDVAGGRDHPLVGRYEGGRLVGFTEKAYEEQRIVTGPVHAADVRAENNQRRNARNSVAVAGRSFRLRYEGPAGRSALEVSRSLEAQLRSRGFAFLFQCRQSQCGSGNGSDLWFALTESTMNPAGGAGVPSNWATGVYAAGRLARDEGDVYLSVYVVERPGPGGLPIPVVLIDVVETRPMEQGRIVFVDAASMQSAIEQTGRVALYGIEFAFDSAEIQPQSRPTLEEIAKYLRDNPRIAVIVAGHTDGQGAFDYNIALSQRRAAAVVQALMRDHGIAAQRLTPFGVGMAAPIASNETEEGRQRNRRVELVRR